MYILRYLRRGIFPLYENHRGHDYALYLELLKDARYFQIPRLEAWIRERRYIDAVKWEYSAESVEGAVGLVETTKSDVEVQHHPHCETRKVYMCPYGVLTHTHRGNPQLCGRQCRLAQRDKMDVFVDR